MNNDKIASEGEVKSYLENYLNREQLRRLYKNRKDKDLTFQQFKAITLAAIDAKNKKNLGNR